MYPGADPWTSKPNGGFPLSPNIQGGLPQPRLRRRIKSDPNASVIFEPPNRIDDARNRRLEQKNLHTLLSPTAETPLPPEWNTLLKRAVKKQYNRALSEVDSRSREYAAIAAMLGQTHIDKVEKIVNPVLWEQFAKKRIEMLKLKSDDLELLTNVGLSKEELKTCHEYLRRFQQHPKVADVPYNDNMALLFHCTKDEKNIDSILASGLDERIGNGGLLGRGIYFSDNSYKSMSYDQCGIIFIFAVLLGDCISLDQKMFSSLVREPKKHEEQKRNNNDLFFDSVFGQPRGANEYVIYNRHQCYPLYMVKYKPVSSFGGAMGIGSGYHGIGSRHLGIGNGSSHFGDGLFGIGGGPFGIGGGHFGIGGSHFGIGGLRSMSLVTGTSLDFPPFCWRSETGSYHMPSFERIINNEWSFYAKNQFAKME